MRLCGPHKRPLFIAKGDELRATAREKNSIRSANVAKTKNVVHAPNFNKPRSNIYLFLNSLTNKVLSDLSNASHPSIDGVLPCKLENLIGCRRILVKYNAAPSAPDVPH